MQPSSSRSPPPPPLVLDSAAPATSFVFTSSQYHATSPTSRHSRQASLSSRLLKEHAHGAFGAKPSPESILPPGFVQLSSTTNTTTANTTAPATKTVISDPVPSSSRPLWLPRFARSAYQPQSTIILTATSDSPIDDPDSYFPPLHSLGQGSSTANTSPVCSAASSPIQSTSLAQLPVPSRRTTGAGAHELSLTELMNGNDGFGSTNEVRDGAGPRYQTMHRPPRPSPKARSERKAKDSAHDKHHPDRPAKKRMSSSSDGTVVSTLEPMDKLKSELRRLSIAATSLSEIVPSGEDTEKGGDKAEPDIAPQPPPHA